MEGVFSRACLAQGGLIHEEGFLVEAQAEGISEEDSVGGAGVLVGEGRPETGDGIHDQGREVFQRGGENEIERGDKRR